MKKLFIAVFFVAQFYESFAQEKQTYDLVKFTAPKGWIREIKVNHHAGFTMTNKKTKTYCQIFIVNSTKSKGSIEEDVRDEWKNLVAGPYKISDSTSFTKLEKNNGWEVQAANAPFQFNQGTSTAMLTTYSGYGRVMSIVAVTNSKEYFPNIQAFVKSVEMKKPDVQSDPDVLTNPVKSSTNYTFNTTNFDDGWTSRVKENWVETTKGNIQVLIHYPNKHADKYSSDLMEGLKNAWNILVAPKYSSASNMEFRPTSGWEPIEFAEAEMVEKVSGKTVYVVLFKKNFTSGSGKYIEFITPNKKTFEQEFGSYANTSANFGTGSGWDKMADMATYNKFAVASSDLSGKWTSNFSGMTQYVNAYTGASAGANTHASNENFEFGAGNTYKWDLGVASGFVGNIKFQSVQAQGKFSMIGNWQVSFSDIEGKPKTFNVQFTCIKGARVLWIGDTAFGKKD